MLLDNVKSFVAGSLVGASVLGAVGLTFGYRWGAGDLSDLKSRLATQEVKVVTVERVVKETVYQDRVEYRDRVKLVTEKLPVIVEREVYKNICLDDDGVAAFNTLMGR